MKYTTFDEHQFRRTVDNAVQQVKTILGTTKNPRLAADEDHTYEDKYALGEYVTNSSIAALLHVLDRLGLDAQKLQTLLQWVNDDKKTVTLSFRAEDGCAFLQETVVDHVVSPSVLSETTETEQKDGEGGTTTTTKSIEARVVKKVKQYHWKVSVNYAIAAYPGNEAASAVELQSRNTSAMIVTSAGMANDYTPQTPTPPIPEYTVHNPVEVDITWLLTSLNREAGVCQFAIDRSLDTCKTPRRNEQVEAAIEFEKGLYNWVNGVLGFFSRRLDGDILSKHNPLQAGEAAVENSLSNGTDATAIYKPIVPFLEDGSVLPPAETGALLEAHSQSINQSCLNVAQMFPPSQLSKLATTAEATIVLLCNHTRLLIEQYKHSIDYIEGMLTNQLIQAIGKQVNSRDFETFMRFHNQKLFGPMYAPKPFTYAIRRPDHYPDGVLSIETSEETPNSIETLVRHVSGSGNPPISIPINAATSVKITGDRFLHGWIQHRFESESTPQHRVAARARQFSSFLLVLGNMAGKDKFSPKSAIILQNKDEVLIPLLTEVLPTAKEFKDAIASLSPEQQAFAKAYRGMQLESSVFGLCIIQLKPQLEKLLGLPAGALTKEIKLTQDLMSLFVDYQIPSDLLSFDGDPTLNTVGKLDAVKGHVKAVLDVIDGAKEKQLLEEERKAEMREAQAAPSPFGGSPTPITFGFGSAAPAPTGGLFGSPAPAPTGLFGGAPPGAMAKSAVASSPPPGAVMASSTPAFGGSPSPAPPPPAANVAVNHVPNQTGQAQQPPSIDAEFVVVDDFTLVPKALDAKVEQFDADSSLKSTIITAGPYWTRMRQENLLTKLERTRLSSDDVGREKNKAFDLLDAISRSGTLSIDCAELHVVVALSHCFENDVMGTIIQDNINPIEKVERSSLIVGATIHDLPSQALLQGNENVTRLATTFPALFSE